MTKTEIDDLTFRVLACAIEVHKTVGPGLLEGVYQKLLAYEFQLSGIHFQREVQANIEYKGLVQESYLRCDFLVENTIIVELKSRKYTTYF